ncbi:unnamed protein product, partial [Protopolystoma xenopodis]
MGISQNHEKTDRTRLAALTLNFSDSDSDLDPNLSSDQPTPHAKSSASANAIIAKKNTITEPERPACQIQ